MKLSVWNKGEWAQHEVLEGKTISEALLKLGYFVALPCGGKGHCGKCAVKAKGNLSLKTEQEREVLLKNNYTEEYRLACTTRILGDASVELELQKSLSVLLDGYIGSYTLCPMGSRYGLAVDIGTTTIAGYLFDLSEGKMLSCHACGNSQRAFGADVVSRMEYALKGKGEEVSSAVRKDLKELISALCEKANILSTEIDAAVITGNTAMLYLVNGEDVSPIAYVPFTLSRPFGEGVGGFLPEMLQVPVYFPPCISAYVGADFLCSMLASGMMETGKTTLLLDIGTNGEMALMHRGKLTCCSTAAGPAFEGAGIAMGSLAQEGAVNKVVLKDDSISCSVIGDVPAKSICGSGLLDAVAAFYALGFIEDTGRINYDLAAKEGYLMTLFGKKVLRVCQSVYISQEDIRAVQLAKAAICAGVETLLQKNGLSVQDLDEILIAGGFGNNLDLSSAEAIGMLPTGSGRIAKSIGNAAGTGAAMLLLDQNKHESARKILQAANTIELSTDPFFMNRYIQRMNFRDPEDLE